MSEAKHTPGPWKQKGRQHNLSNVILGPSGVRVAVASLSRNQNLMRMDEHGYEPEETVMANAKLIAAAPELLKSLRQLVWNWENNIWTDADIEEAKASLKKASNEY